MTGSSAFLSEVRDLVVIEAGVRHHPVGREEVSGVRLLIGCHDRSAIPPSAERRGMLDSESIKRDMIRRELEGLLEIGFPRSVEHLRQRKNQIDRDVVETGIAERLECTDGSCGIVDSMHPSKYGVIEALNTERNAIDACFPPRRSLNGIDVIRGGPDGDLGFPIHTKATADEIQDARNSACPEPGRSTAAEIDRIERIISDRF